MYKDETPVSMKVKIPNTELYEQISEVIGKAVIYVDPTSTDYTQEQLTQPFPLKLTSEISGYPTDWLVLNVEFGEVTSVKLEKLYDGERGHKLIEKLKQNRKAISEAEIDPNAREDIEIIKTAINDFEALVGKQIPLEDILIEAKKRGIEKEKVEKIIQKLKAGGDIYSPKPGIISKI